MILLVIAAIVILIIFLCRGTTTGSGASGSYGGSDYSNLYNGAAPPPKRAQNAADYSAHYPGSPNPVPQPAAAPVQKTPFTPVTLLLVAGVIFLLFGGIIFLTNTWEMLPDLARACSLLSASVVAFVANILAERVFKLRKTGLAFYILGCIFLPLALGGIGVFELLGNWFSFHGDGWMLVWALICFCLAVTSFLGQGNYKSAFLAWTTLSGLSGMWVFFSLYITSELLPGSDALKMTVFNALLFVYAAATTIGSEIYLRARSEAGTPLSKAMLPYIYLQNLLYAIPLMLTVDTAPLSVAVISALLALLFMHKRFIGGGIHGGIFGFCLCMLLALSSASTSDVFADATGLDVFIFIIAAMTFILLNIACSAKDKAIHGTFMATGLIFAIPTAIFSLCKVINGDDFLFLYVPLGIALVHFLCTKKNKLSSHTKLFVLFAPVLYSIAYSGAEEDNLLFMLLLIVAALLLMIQFFLNRRLWPLVLSICSCGALIMTRLPHAEICILWLCVAALLIGMIYALTAKRMLLARCCEWAGLPLLLTACVRTFDIVLTGTQAWILAFAALALVQLTELTMGGRSERAHSMCAFCSNLSVWLGIVISIAILVNNQATGWLMIFALSMLVFAASNLKRDINFIAIPMLIILHVSLTALITSLENFFAGNLLLGIQVACYAAVLLVFCLMGRLLLPLGFCVTDGTGKRIQIDWALIAGVLPIFGAAITLDWYPAILVCLFLSIYSLLYIGRVKTHYVPALLASLFACLTIFFHNIYDPFTFLEFMRDSDIKTPQILLTVLPLHLFLLSLLWILPKKTRPTVHVLRFCMYCFTMASLVIASLSFGHVADALILAVFSFLIFAASFFVKRLRWFALGFSVLMFITIRMTWHFWTSLHWGIYLFLAGILLIGIACYYEYAVRRAAEHPDEPKKKIRLFKEWKW